AVVVVAAPELDRYDLGGRRDMVRRGRKLAGFGDRLAQQFERDLGGSKDSRPVSTWCWQGLVDGLDHTGRDDVAVVVGADLDGLKAACDPLSFGTVLHEFDGRHYQSGGVPLHRDLRIGGAGERRMPTRATIIDAAMVNHDDGAAE